MYLPGKFAGPTRILFKNTITSSPKIIAEKMKNYYVDKIEKLSESINKDSTRAMAILRELVPKTNSVFSSREVSLE